ncbi:hypothetical protein MTP99_002264 [Tenebrio molitor]|nr:hypothetical protein MTP99_002264 [Tenebrio molitor]
MLECRFVDAVETADVASAVEEAAEAVTVSVVVEAVVVEVEISVAETVLEDVAEDDLVAKVEIEDVPFFNAPIYLENKEQIGKIDEIFGNLRDYYVTIRLGEDIKASSFKKHQKLFIDPAKLKEVALAGEVAVDEEETGVLVEEVVAILVDEAGEGVDLEGVVEEVDSEVAEVEAAKNGSA